AGRYPSDPPGRMRDMTSVLIETGATWTWASALDWPGWCRRGKGDEAALEQLLAYADRYAQVVPGFRPGRVEVVATVVGPKLNEWAPSVTHPSEDALPTAKQLAALESCWAAFDRGVAGSSAALQKGPRGGGRDRDAIVDHVMNAERAYGRKVGVRVPPRTAWQEQRADLLGGLRKPEGPWLPRYAVRRIAWHVLD